MKITPVLHNIRSAYNVGAILRTAEGLGIETVALSGYTPRYQDAKLLPHLREKLNRQIAKSALGAETMVQQIPVDDLFAWLLEKRANRALILGLENNLSPAEAQRKLILGSDELQDKLRRIEISSQAARNMGGEVQDIPAGEVGESVRETLLILGEEVQGIPAQIRKFCEYFVEIPMAGRKESFNVSVATSIALWDLQRQGGMI